MTRGNNAKRTKLLAMILSVVLLLGCVAGGTVAWLIDETDEVVNTFTYGDINIDLEESPGPIDDKDDDEHTNKYEMIPGETIKKDPVITVKAGSEEMWLFVKLEESENFDDFMTYEVEGLGTAWLPLEGEDGVYFRHITAEEVAEEDMLIHVLKDDEVHVKGEVTKEMLNALDADGKSDYPTLTVTAYAVQFSGMPTAADAWAQIQ